MAPVATMLSLTLTYQSEVANCNWHISGITDKKLSLLRQTSKLADQREDRMSGLDMDDPQYQAAKKEIDAEFDKQERELEALELEMEEELDQWETRKTMAEQYLQSFQGGLQDGLSKSFAPFPGQ